MDGHVSIETELNKNPTMGNVGLSYALIICSNDKLLCM